MPPNSTAAAKRQPLTLAQLSTYDDILTDALVDHVSTIPNKTWAISHLPTSTVMS